MAQAQNNCFPNIKIGMVQGHNFPGIINVQFHLFFISLFSGFIAKKNTQFYYIPLEKKNITVDSNVSYFQNIKTQSYS